MLFYASNISVKKLQGVLLEKFIASKIVLSQQLMSNRMNPFFPYTNVIDKLITRLHESYLMKYDLERDSGRNKMFIYQEEKAKPQSLMLDNMMISFKVLMVGLIISITLEFIRIIASDFRQWPRCEQRF